MSLNSYQSSGRTGGIIGFASIITSIAGFASLFALTHAAWGMAAAGVTLLGVAAEWGIERFLGLILTVGAGGSSRHEDIPLGIRFWSAVALTLPFAAAALALYLSGNSVWMGVIGLLGLMVFGGGMDNPVYGPGLPPHLIVVGLVTLAAAPISLISGLGLPALISGITGVLIVLSGIFLSLLQNVPSASKVRSA